MAYKWDYPSGWLRDKIQEHATDANWLKTQLVALVGELDEDTVQDIFQSDMDADGYFDEETDDPAGYTSAYCNKCGDAPFGLSTMRCASCGHGYEFEPGQACPVCDTGYIEIVNRDIAICRGECKRMWKLAY